MKSEFAKINPINHYYFKVLYNLSKVCIRLIIYLTAMSAYPSIHDAYGGFGERPDRDEPTTITVLPPVSNRKDTQKDTSMDEQPGNSKLPTDASHSNYPVKIKCPKCHKVGVTRIQSELGTASWVWCVLLAPFACAGLTCLCIESCRDKVHFCLRCGHVVGKKYAKVC